MAPRPSLTEHPLLWRGNQVPARLATLATGHAALDAALPGHGWPLNAVTELVNDTAGCGELSLLLPSLVRLSQENHWIVMLDPPWIPYPPALQNQGLALAKLLLVNTSNRGESLWACEQVLRGLPGGAVLAWPGELSFGELRRLQLAAAAGGKAAFLFRNRKTAAVSSPAALRLQLTPAGDELKIRVLKCRGQRPASDICIRRPWSSQPQPPQPRRGEPAAASPESPPTTPEASPGTAPAGTHRPGRPARLQA